MILKNKEIKCFSLLYRVLDINKVVNKKQNFLKFKKREYFLNYYCFFRSFVANSLPNSTPN